jgi:hypothetical protein
MLYFKKLPMRYKSLLLNRCRKEQDNFGRAGVGAGAAMLSYAVPASSTRGPSLMLNIYLTMVVSAVIPYFQG